MTNVLKKSGFVAATAAGLLMLGSPAFADDTDYSDGAHGQLGLVNVGDVLNDNNVGVCDNNVNVLGVQVTDVANGLGLALPLLSPGSATENDGVAPDICAAESDD